MTKVSFVEYAWIMIGVLSIAFAIVKFIMIIIYKPKVKASYIYFTSFLNINRYAIEGYHNSATRKYLKSSNRVNNLFYMAGISIVLINVFCIYII